MKGIFFIQSNKLYDKSTEADIYCSNINDKNLEGISTNTDHWIRIYYIVFSATDAGADYKLLKVEGGVYGPPSAPMEPNINSWILNIL